MSVKPILDQVAQQLALGESQVASSITNDGIEVKVATHSRLAVFHLFDAELAAVHPLVEVPPLLSDPSR